MAIVSHREVWEERSGSRDGKRNSDYKRVFLVEANDPLDTQAEVLDYCEGTIIALGALHPDDPSSYLEKWDVAAHGTYTGWKATANYNQAGGDPQALGLPTDRPTLWQVEFQKNKRVMEQDNAFAPLINTAKQPYSPPYEKEETTVILVATKYLSAVNLDTIRDYQDAVNDNDWTTPHGTIPKWFAKCNITVERIWESGEEAFKHVHRFEMSNFRNPYTGAKIGWRPLFILDQGFNELGTDGKPKPIQDKTGKALSHASLLDADGHYTITPHYTEYTMHDEKDFAALGL